MNKLVFIMDSVRFDVAEEAYPGGLGDLHHMRGQATCTFPTATNMIFNNAFVGSQDTSHLRQNEKRGTHTFILTDNPFMSDSSEPWCWARKHCFYTYYQKHDINTDEMLSDTVGIAKGYSNFEIYVWLMDTHSPYYIDREPCTLYFNVRDRLKRMNKGQDKVEQETLTSLRQRQVDCTRHLFHRIQNALKEIPPGVDYVILSDHGEQFGEEGKFGHGNSDYKGLLDLFKIEGRT